MSSPIIDNYFNNDNNNDYIRRFSFSIPEPIITPSNESFEDTDMLETNISTAAEENSEIIKTMGIMPIYSYNKIKYKIPTDKAKDAREIWLQAKIGDEEIAYNIELKLICWAFDFAIANVSHNKITKITWITSSGCKCDSTWKAFLNWILCASTSTNPIVNTPNIVVNLPSSKL